MTDLFYSLNPDGPRPNAVLRPSNTKAKSSNAKPNSFFSTSASNSNPKSSRFSSTSNSNSNSNSNATPGSSKLDPPASSSPTQIISLFRTVWDEYYTWEEEYCKRVMGRVMDGVAPLSSQQEEISSQWTEPATKTKEKEKKQQAWEEEESAPPKLEEEEEEPVRDEEDIHHGLGHQILKHLERQNQNPPEPQNHKPPEEPIPSYQTIILSPMSYEVIGPPVSSSLATSSTPASSSAPSNSVSSSLPSNSTSSPSASTLTPSSFSTSFAPSPTYTSCAVASRSVYLGDDPGLLGWIPFADDESFDWRNYADYFNSGAWEEQEDLELPQILLETARRAYVQFGLTYQDLDDMDILPLRFLAPASTSESTPTSTQLSSTLTPKSSQRSHKSTSTPKSSQKSSPKDKGLKKSRAKGPGILSKPVVLLWDSEVARATSRRDKMTERTARPGARSSSAASRSQPPYIPSSNTNSPRTELNNMVARFCTNLNCLSGYCLVHIDNMPLPQPVPATLTSEALKSKSKGKEACGEECFLLESEPTLAFDTDWSADDLSILHIVLDASPDTSPCDLAVIMGASALGIGSDDGRSSKKGENGTMKAQTTGKSCRDCFVQRRMYIKDEAVAGKGRKSRKVFAWSSKPSKHSFKHDNRTFVPNGPCGHPGPCSSQSLCDCWENHAYCEEGCRCEVGCKRRFKFCVCKSNCRTKTCACFVASRECDPKRCHVGGSHSTCKNADIQKGNWKQTQVIRSEWGFGLALCEDATEGDLIVEYVGELVFDATTESRDEISRHLHLNYLFELNPLLAIDSSRVGSVARFVNHDKARWNVVARVRLINGEHRIGLYAARPISKGQELWMDYGQVFFREDGGEPDEKQDSGRGKSGQKEDSVEELEGERAEEPEPSDYEEEMEPQISDEDFEMEEAEIPQRPLALKAARKIAWSG
ncbi:hypothetical protein C8J56DRAFT_493886 [Mycena floridula]|nr:hypothetical protein C8J56DRAFT_493886 [Mycena floridula]